MLGLGFKLGLGLGSVVRVRVRVRVRARAGLQTETAPPRVCSTTEESSHHETPSHCSIEPALPPGSSSGGSGTPSLPRGASAEPQTESCPSRVRVASRSPPGEKARVCGLHGPAWGGVEGEG